jgi:hypothetical protein
MNARCKNACGIFVFRDELHFSNLCCTVGRYISGQIVEYNLRVADQIQTRYHSIRYRSANHYIGTVRVMYAALFLRPVYAFSTVFLCVYLSSLLVSFHLSLYSIVCFVISSFSRRGTEAQEKLHVKLLFSRKSSEIWVCRKKRRCK